MSLATLKPFLFMARHCDESPLFLRDRHFWMFNWLNTLHSLRLQCWQLTLAMLLWEHIIQAGS